MFFNKESSYTLSVDYNQFISENSAVIGEKQLFISENSAYIGEKSILISEGKFHFLAAIF